MMYTRRMVWGRGVLVFLTLLGVLCPAARAASPDEALAEYVNRPDASYGWTVRQQAQLGPSTAYELTLTSQMWKDLIWRHRLFLIVPPSLKGNADPLLIVEGGSWDDRFAQALPDGEADAFPKEAILLGGYAQQLGSPIAVLLNVPRQPIFEGRKEDAIIALTFDKFFETGDSDWLLLLPMVKSAVKAMDALQEFGQEELGLAFESFTVGGASKRGWTTWLTAAIDPRVDGLVPMVIDMLNLEPQLKQQLDDYGKFSRRIKDYTERDLPRRMSGASGEVLRQIVDPFSYRQQITQPKLIMLGSNDGFWTVDALNLYWDELVGEKYVCYVPNADHDLNMDVGRILGGVDALHRHVHNGKTMPHLSWDYTDAAEGGGAVKLDVQPGREDATLRLWSTTSATADFRESTWTDTPLLADASGRYQAELSNDDSGYRAYFVEVVYPDSPLALHLTTTIRVLPPSE